ncbi:hypothetical protein [Glacieibacterium sp.]|uniref:hypothetical protein n=1 Tax=Glacieibacterium sp. TaxID=2860237 RepID=UPI003AFFF9BB
MRGLILAVAIFAAAPVLAQSSLKPPESTDGTKPRERFVIVYGNDPCPKATSSDEVVVCGRRPDEERYRIPPAIRNAQGKVAATNGRRSRIVGLAAGGAGGSIGSCSPIGAGGGTGCNQQMQDDYREEKNPR